MTRLLSCILAAALLTAPLHAQAPAPIGQIISYSGKLTNTDGTPVTDGQKVLGIKLYADGAAVTGFAQSPTVFTVGGVFTTFLQYNGVIFDPTKKYELGVTAPGQGEIKMPLSSVPVAQVAATVPDGAITDAKIASVSPAKLTAQITETQIADGAITRSKAPSLIQGPGDNYQVRTDRATVTTDGSGEAIVLFDRPFNYGYVVIASNRDIASGDIVISSEYFNASSFKVRARRGAGYLTNSSIYISYIAVGQ